MSCVYRKGMYYMTNSYYLIYLNEPPEIVNTVVLKNKHIKDISGISFKKYSIKIDKRKIMKFCTEIAPRNRVLGNHIILLRALMQK